MFYQWDFDRRKMLGRFHLNTGGIGNVFSLAFLPDKRHFVAFRSRPAELRVVDVERFQTVLLLRSIPLEGQRMVAMTGSNAVPKIRITHDGRFAVTNSSESNRLAFWDLHLHLALGKKQP